MPSDVSLAESELNRCPWLEEASEPSDDGTNDAGTSDVGTNDAGSEQLLDNQLEKGASAPRI